QSGSPVGIGALLVSSSSVAGLLGTNPCGVLVPTLRLEWGSAVMFDLILRLATSTPKWQPGRDWRVACVVVQRGWPPRYEPLWGSRPYLKVGMGICSHV